MCDENFYGCIVFRYLCIVYTYAMFFVGMKNCCRISFQKEIKVNMTGKTKHFSSQNASPLRFLC